MRNTQSAPMLTNMSDDLEVDANDEAMDSRSSSLSEVDEVNDAEPLTSPPLEPSNPALDLENDSEAETERLDQVTPRARRATLSDGKFSGGKAGSALSQGLAIESDPDDDGTPLALLQAGNAEVAVDDDDALSSLELETSPHKRKRSSSEGSPLSDAMDLDEPGRKRPHEEYSEQDESSINGEGSELQLLEDITKTAEVEDEMDNEALEDGEDVMGTAEDDETSAEEVKVTRSNKGRLTKGKKKGKRRRGNESRTITTSLDGPPTEVDGEEATALEADADEEEANAIDEELARKRLALDGLASIEKYFNIFRQKYLEDELEDVTKQMQLLKDAECIHPEYLLKRACVDLYRDKKITYETTLRRYKLQTARKTLVAERAQIGSQFAQSARQVRDTILEQANQHFYKLQRDRRKWGMDERNHLRMFNADRRQQVKDQSRINLEVSILSGVAKHVGFPAAPGLSALSREEGEEDLRKMGIPPLARRSALPGRQAPVYEPRSHPSAPTTTTTIIHHPNPERTAAAAEFYESTPWANPNHPSHAQSAATSFYHSQPDPSSTITPHLPFSQTTENTGPSLTGRQLDPRAAERPSTNVQQPSGPGSLVEQLSRAASGGKSGGGNDAQAILNHDGNITNHSQQTTFGKPDTTAGHDGEQQSPAPLKDVQTLKQSSSYAAGSDTGPLLPRPTPLAVGVGGDRMYSG